MKGHAAVPHPQYLHGVGPVGVKIIEQYVAQARPRHHAEHGPGDEVVHLILLPAGAGAGRPVTPQQPGQQKGYHVHEAVPVQTHGAEGDGNGIDGGIGEHTFLGEGHVS